MRQYKESKLSKKQKGAKQLHINRQHVQHDHRKELQQSKISNAPQKPRPKYSSTICNHKSGSVSLTQHKTATLARAKSVRRVLNFDHDQSKMVVPPAPELAEESLPHEILFKISISVGVPTQPIHSTPNASPEHVFVIPLDPEIDEEEDVMLSLLIPDNLTDSIPLDLEDLMHIPPGPLSAISPISGTSYGQERTHQFSASNYDNLSVTPTISSLSLINT